MTVLEVIQRSADYLAKKGVDSPRLQVELMLAHVLQLPRLQLYLDFERKLTDAELAALRPLVRRRGTREPLQHILGSTSFCGLDLAVTRHVLIPRPETEQLAELAANHLSTRAPQPATILDLCTGSGCLAIYLAVKHPAASVFATDISPDALQVALANASQSGVSGRITFLQGDLFTPLPAGLRVDLIVSNPPYIPSAEIDTLPPEVRDHDPRAALDGGADGLEFFRAIAAEAPHWLKPGGVLMAEFDDGQGPALLELFSAAPWRSQRVEKDLSGRERFFIASAAGA